MTGGLLHICNEISLEPSVDLGHICGLILGDASLFKTKTCNYGIRLESTDSELTQLFYDSIKKIFPLLNPFFQTRKKVRSFPNGQIYDTPTEIVTVYSKRLYDALQPFKAKDYHWTIPTFLTTNDSQIGFLIGIFDAEGGIHLDGGDKIPSVVVYSKHKSNLEHVKQVLLNFAINSWISPIREQWRLEASSVDLLRTKMRFIPFRLPRKRLHYLHLLANAHPKRYRELAREFCESIEFEEVKCEVTAEKAEAD